MIDAILRASNLTAYLVNAIVLAVYFVYFWSNAGRGQTLAMRLLHLKVVKTDGSLLTTSSAIGRLLGLWLGALVLLLGVIWVAFDPNKQGWHDKMAGTYVLISQ